MPICKQNVSRFRWRVRFSVYCPILYAKALMFVYNNFEPANDRLIASWVWFTTRSLSHENDSTLWDTLFRSCTRDSHAMQSNWRQRHHLYNQLTRTRTPEPLCSPDKHLTRFPRARQSLHSISHLISQECTKTSLYTIAANVVVSYHTFYLFLLSAPPHSVNLMTLSQALMWLSHLRRVVVLAPRAGVSQRVSSSSCVHNSTHPIHTYHII